MQRHPVLFRLSAATAVLALLTGQSAPAFAQQAENATQAGDPPGRVGRVAAIAGQVSFHTADQDHWEPATVNYPVTSGNAFWTQPQASADLGVGGTRATLDQSTELDIETLDDQRFIATAPQGEIYLRVTDLQPGEIDTIRTPRGEVRIMAPGRYSIAAGDTATPTVVTVDSGAAQITGPGLTLDVGAHQTASVTGTDSFTGAVGAEVVDPFLAAQLARDRPVQVAGRVAPPPVVEQMTGYDAVASTGDWATSSEYGQVWYPPVDRDWVPYRHGHWGFVAPWGWTWIDDAPWGFAPAHYGRWVEIENRWAWTPVGPDRDAGYRRERPVYAPALVGFVGLAAGVAIGVGIGAAVGWIPLGPREAYRPSYPVSNTYLRNVNATNVTNITTINNQRFINQKSATFAPQSAMQQSQGIAGVARPVSASQLAGIRPLNQPPVQPTLATRGVTPVVARTVALAPVAGQVPQRVAPGPAVTGRSFSAAPVLAPQGGHPVVAPGLAPSPPVARAPGLPNLAPAGGPRVQPPSAPGAAPGPAFTPRGPGQPIAPVAPRPPSPVPGAGAGQPGGTVPAPLRPAAPVAPVAPARPGAPQPVPQAGPLPPVARPAPQPLAPQPQIQRPAPPQPTSQAPVSRPVLQPSAPQPQPQPQVQRPAPLQPAPQVQHVAPPMQQAAPPAPPPVQHAAPPAPPPVQHAAPPPPAPRQASPPAHRSCPPNEKSC